LTAAHAQTVKDPPYDGKGKFINKKTHYPLEVVAALYNYKFVLEDGSKGIHNSTYAVQLLMDFIKALDKNFEEALGKFLLLNLHSKNTLLERTAVPSAGY